MCVSDVEACLRSLICARVHRCTCPFSVCDLEERCGGDGGRDRQQLHLTLHVPK